MITISRSSTNHKFEKQNLVTQFEKGRQYDLYKCSLCGLIGRAYTLTEISVDGRRGKTAHNCPKSEKTEKIKIIRCLAVGKVFSNLIPESVHSVIEPPAGKDNSRGAWVMGVGEPVKVLFEEYEEYDEE